MAAIEQPRINVICDTSKLQEAIKRCRKLLQNTDRKATSHRRTAKLGFRFTAHSVGVNTVQVIAEPIRSASNVGETESSSHLDLWITVSQ